MKKILPSFYFSTLSQAVGVAAKDENLICRNQSKNSKVRALKVAKLFNANRIRKRRLSVLNLILNHPWMNQSLLKTVRRLEIDNKDGLSMFLS